MKLFLCQAIAVGLVVLLAACVPVTPEAGTSTTTPIADATTQRPVQGSTPPPTTDDAAVFTDPFAYCAAIGTIDQPEVSFGTANNPGVPEVIARGLKQASQAPDDAPLEPFQQNAYWRCMDGKVYACFVGANIPCWSQADVSQTPNEAMVAYCQENAQAEFIPAAVTGHETVYEWRCTDGSPTIVRQVLEVDEQGYPVNFWYEIQPN